MKGGKRQRDLKQLSADFDALTTLSMLVINNMGKRRRLVFFVLRTREQREKTRF
jgi:hypothetical protein